MNKLTTGTKVIKSGYQGIITGTYEGMYEVKLRSGTVVVPANELKVVA